MNEQGPRTNVPDAVASFSALNPGEQTYFLAHFAHWLTIIARGAYEAGGNGLNDPAQVRAINEVQHRVTGHLSSLLRGDSKRYPDDVLVKILFEQPEDDVLQQQLFWAFDRAMSGTKATV